MTFIYVTIILDTLGFGITIPVLPRLIVDFAGDTAHGAELFGLFVTVSPPPLDTEGFVRGLLNRSNSGAYK